MSKLVSLDIETTGLDPDEHEMWEAAAVLDDGTAECFQLPILGLTAQPEALRIGQFEERYALHVAQGGGAWDVLREEIVPVWRAAERLCQITSEKVLMGCNVGTFDAVFLAKFLERYSYVPGWGHRFLELGSYAAGVEAAQVPFASRTLSERIPNREEHTALGDALWNWDVFRFYRERA